MNKTEELLLKNYRAMERFYYFANKCAKEGEDPMEILLSVYMDMGNIFTETKNHLQTLEDTYILYENINVDWKI